ncbi:hypothetical protein L3X38_003538 [Prunus dulcis]|uniref:Transposable element protein n=1 Tax=Prunus dulcis TaxID=3755 RepID=A0AAD4ZM80_PRUDU|nr:hypothetical protein L3X38_003538 [Prunus dulcis]
MEEDSNPSRDAQRSLNPNMKEVVRAEVFKLLDEGIIYPISDSKWVSPVQVVPKKSEITIVKNENNELVPTRTITSWRGIEVDKAKINIISNLPPPSSVKGVRSFLGHAGFYRSLELDQLTSKGDISQLRPPIKGRLVPLESPYFPLPVAAHLSLDPPSWSSETAIKQGGLDNFLRNFVELVRTSPATIFF